MADEHSTVAVFNTHASAQAAIRRLSEAGFPIERLSIIDQGCQTGDQVIGSFNLGRRTRLWGKNAALWGGLWGVLSGGVFMTVPMIGPVVVQGHLASMVFGALEGAVVIGGLGALAGALASVGVPNGTVLRNEQDLRAENFLLVVHGSEAQAQRAEALLTADDASRVEIHAPQPAGAAIAHATGNASPVATHVA